MAPDGTWQMMNGLTTRPQQVLLCYLPKIKFPQRLLLVFADTNLFLMSALIWVEIRLLPGF
jgi:hypothetical protein